MTLKLVSGLAVAPGAHDVPTEEEAAEKEILILDVLHQRLLYGFSYICGVRSQTREHHVFITINVSTDPEPGSNLANEPPTLRLTCNCTKGDRRRHNCTWLDPRCKRTLPWLMAVCRAYSYSTTNLPMANF